MQRGFVLKLRVMDSVKSSSFSADLPLTKGKLYKAPPGSVLGRRVNALGASVLERLLVDLMQLGAAGSRLRPGGRSVYFEMQPCCLPWGRCGQGHANVFCIGVCPLVNVLMPVDRVVFVIWFCLC
jgi:hypothetical protein